MPDSEPWLALVGLGLSPGAIPVRGLELARRAEHVFLEGYTARAPEPVDRLEERVEGPVEEVGRAAVEDGTRLVDAAREGGACLLVAGDPFSATTHTSLRLAAKEAGVPVRVCYAGSILTAAAGALGLSHYKFGRATTLVTPDGDYFPTSPYDVLAGNLERDLHTLVLLDIRDDGTCMRADEAAGLLLELEERCGGDAIDGDTLAVALARAGREDEAAWRGPLSDLVDLDAGAPMHSLVVPGALSPLEEEALAAFADPA